jgi:hypothetical protein
MRTMKSRNGSRSASAKLSRTPTLLRSRGRTAISPDPYDVDEDLQEDPAAGRWPGSSARRQSPTGPGGPTGQGSARRRKSNLVSGYIVTRGRAARQS